MELNQVIKKPLITEKTMIATSSGKFTFMVHPRATKELVKNAVESFFKVDVKKVWLTVTAGKSKRVGKSKRNVITKPDWKKAIVKLAKDQKIDLFEIKKAKK